jgi:sugar phosphate isomerase/epimerase
MTDFSFKVGTTSYIFPDEILPNVRRLKDSFDDIELLFFESGNLPGSEVINELKNIRQKSGISYTIHLPLDLNIADPEESIRSMSVKKIVSIIKDTISLDPSGYILHIPGYIRRKYIDWCNQTALSLEEITKGIDFNSKLLCLENLDYPPGLLDKFISDFDLSLCLDTGHLIKNEQDVKKYFEKYISNSRIIHLYGIEDSGLHGGLNKIDKGLLNWIMEFIDKQNFDEIVTLEVFSEQDLKESLKIMESVSGRKEVSE